MKPNQLFAKLRLQLPALAKAERKAADYILEHQDDMYRLNLQELAGNSGCSQAAIIRMCKAIGLDGFKQLKAELGRQSALSNELFPGNGAEEESAGGSMEKVLKEVFSYNVRSFWKSHLVASNKK